MSLKRKVYENPSEKTKDFKLGFKIWLLVNIVLLLVAFFGLSGELSVRIYWIPLAINLGMILYFAFTRSQVAFGMLAAFGSMLIFPVCLWAFFSITCAVLGGQ